MSIISEALKKAEKNAGGQVIFETSGGKAANESRVHSPVVNFATNPVKDSNLKMAWAWNWETVTVWALVAATFILLAGLFHFPVLPAGFAFNSGASRISLITSPIQTGFLTGKAMRSANLKSAIAKKSPYRLTGITVYPDGKYYAILNESVVGVGDYIDGAFVQAISDGEVILDSTRGEVKLRLALD